MKTILMIYAYILLPCLLHACALHATKHESRSSILMQSLHKRHLHRVIDAEIALWQEIKYYMNNPSQDIEKQVQELKAFKEASTPPEWHRAYKKLHDCNNSLKALIKAHTRDLQGKKGSSDDLEAYFKILIHEISLIIKAAQASLDAHFLSDFTL